MKVAELEGAELDYWVARAEELPVVILELGDGDFECYPDDAPLSAGYHYKFSRSWEEGGPIAHRELIGFHPMSDGKQWLATDYQIRQPHAYGQGPTPLIAAMRCYVAMKFGDDVPDYKGSE